MQQPPVSEFNMFTLKMPDWYHEGLTARSFSLSFCARDLCLSAQEVLLHLHDSDFMVELA